MASDYVVDDVTILDDSGNYRDSCVKKLNNGQVRYKVDSIRRDISDIVWQAELTFIHNC